MQPSLKQEPRTQTSQNKHKRNSSQRRQVFQNWTREVTHLIAAAKDYKFGAHVKQQRDVVSLEWLLECSHTRQRTAIRPHHYLHLSKKTLQEVPGVCRFGDL